MKRFFFVVAFCTSLLTGLGLFLFPPARAAENPLLALLNLPAPPPPNPQVTLPPVVYPDNFFSKSNPPPDDMPIEYLMAYWRAQSSDFSELRYKVYPSDKVLARLIAELSKNPAEIGDFLNIFPPGDRSADFIKSTYNRMSNGDEELRHYRSALRRWLKYNTREFSFELERDASRVADANSYVSFHNELIALARVDWDRAAPIVSRLYSNPGQRASQTAALWALYLHAIEEGSTGDAERYRDELQKTIADRSLPDGIRDLALDALSLEKEWPGRDEWYVSQLEDETLLDLGTYTGLTTLVSVSPDEKYIERMIALLDSDNINVRTAAARNLLLKVNTNRPDIVKALLPWISDPRWVRMGIDGRESVIRALGRIKLPDAVPVLIAALDEKETRRSPDGNANGAAANAMRRAIDAADAIANAANSAVLEDANSPRYSSMISNVNSSSFTGSPDSYPLRGSAIAALSYQADTRAVPALRRLLNETADSPYERTTLIDALYNCRGFTVAEQVDAVEDVAANFEQIQTTIASNAVANYVGHPTADSLVDPFIQGTLDLKRALGVYLAKRRSVGEDVARAVVDRITALDRSDPATAAALRRIVIAWQARAVYALSLRDLKAGRTDAASLVRLLTARHYIREEMQSDLYEIRSANATAFGISACIIEDPNDFDSILDGPSDEAKTAMLACARLIRAPLRVQKVAENLQSKDRMLALAAERYLESEDSAEARRIVLSLHPGEARILGSKVAFFPDQAASHALEVSTRELFATVNPYFHPSVYSADDYAGDSGQTTEKLLREEVMKNPDLLGVYNWLENYIHVYKDRAVLSWHDDPARYRERVLTKEEFDNFKGLIVHFRAEELKPFLSCGNCPSRQLIMLGRNGGRRVFVRSFALPQFFLELDRVFDAMRLPPATIKYWAARDIPGLEVLFADDRFKGVTVWKNGSDLRLLTVETHDRIPIEGDLPEVAGGAGEEEGEDGNESPDHQPEEANPRLQRWYENYAWFGVSNGKLGAAASQPTDAEYILPTDSFNVRPSSERWKARAGAVEIRADDKGLYRVAGGKLTKIKSGSYEGPVMTPNGRWVVVSKYDDDYDVSLVRVNLLTNKEFVVRSEELPVYRAIAFVPSINRILVGPYDHDYEHYYQGPDDHPPMMVENGGGLSLLDPETGALIAARGEVRPIVQQTFRPLQPTGTPYEFWAAVPNGNETVIGTYNSRNFNLKPAIKLPRLNFDSMSMWIDSAGGKAYFVYGGHLLAVPLKTGQ